MSTAEKLRQEGKAEGRAEGRAEGIAEGRKERLLAFVRKSNKQGIPIEIISKIVELDENLIEQILNNKNIEIPLHLLEENS
nr:hypothetical protein [uncultured Desulfobacter sp.]